MKIKYLMNQNVTCIDKDQNICDALRIMKKNNISRLVVINTNNEHIKEVVGIITEKDIAEKLGSSRYGNLAPSHFHVSTVMSSNLITADVNMDVSTAADIMLENHIGSLPVIEDDKLVGILTKTDILEICKGKPYEKPLVEDVMSSELITIEPTERMIHARRLMIDANIGRLPVMEDGELVGIITSKDIARSMIAFRKIVPDKYKSARIRNLLVEDLMTQNVKTVKTTDTISKTASKMIETGYGGFPVLDDNGTVVGIITKSDILDLIVEMEGG
ncbi:CBS domain-containing protein [Methanothermobacter tenebrarum]|uniref:Inosine-5-monophosphate dehydrogenase n=1 Tax=Methanothermobacter tenebrarum TaxID=680118 RepID=A0A328PIS7_9EURY|nr:CBS domain-containing protein [Methanothermobacter tenebrarum]MBC7101424.1 CBS domain-containing protein [Methanobacteriales archaeon]MBC7118383.1 CBS domain-containing protein [Methanobacteriaceae archaeon]NPV65235.1 CBS domain-containing protein [Methanobacteriaceae archaeon]RAO79596.1 inosine-5-monophosphate dehydrogenase [Methanothermobacter tenebrarum]